MRSPDIEIWIFSRPDRALSVAERHARFVEKMVSIATPLGFHDLQPPDAPKDDDLGIAFSVKYPIKGLRCIGDYTFREQSYNWYDHGSYDEHLRFKFSVTNRSINYLDIVYDNLPLVIEAFNAYKAYVYYDNYHFEYEGGLHNNNIVYNELSKLYSDGMDGRNSIYTLHPAQFWDGELCKRALGLSQNEVIKRLEDEALLVRPLADGVYTVLNCEKQLSYESYVNMNRRFKDILGLI